MTTGITMAITMAIKGFPSVAHAEIKPGENLTFPCNTWVKVKQDYGYTMNDKFVLCFNIIQKILNTKVGLKCFFKSIERIMFLIFMGRELHRALSVPQNSNSYAICMCLFNTGRG